MPLAPEVEPLFSCLPTVTTRWANLLQKQSLIETASVTQELMQVNVSTSFGANKTGFPAQ
jgi:hypothetical protein